MGENMNKNRRQSLRNAIKLLTDASTLIESVCDDEEDALSNTPENLQNTERYENMENAVDCLNEASDKLDEVMECIEQAIRG